MVLVTLFFWLLIAVAVAGASLLYGLGRLLLATWWPLWAARRRTPSLGPAVSRRIIKTVDVMMPIPHDTVLKALEHLHAPCPHLDQCNREWRAQVPGAQLWQPEAGFVPCSFFGAFGEPDDVELVIAIAEPSNNPLERFSPDAKRADR